MNHKKDKQQNSIIAAHEQADRDIQKDEDLAVKGREDELDEGELARLEGQDKGEMDLSKQENP